MRWRMRQETSVRPETSRRSTRPLRDCMCRHRDNNTRVGDTYNSRGRDTYSSRDTYGSRGGDSYSSRGGDTYSSSRYGDSYEMSGRRGFGGGGRGRGDRGEGLRGETKVLFVGNLSYDTDEHSLRNAFEGSISARIPTHADSGKPKGIAFVEFNSAEEAEDAYDLMYGGSLDGRDIAVDFAEDRNSSGGGRSGGFDRGDRRDYGGRGGRFDSRSSRGGRFDRGGFGGGFSGRGDVQRGVRGETKVLFVGNISFDADERSICDAFRGSVSARLPVHANSGRPKGIAYVEFNSPEEASEAHDAMQGQTLDGRDITVDFALDRGSDGGRSAGGFDRRDEGGRRGGGFSSSRGRGGSRYGGAGARGPVERGVRGETKVLFVGNISFDATEDSICDAFGAVSARLPVHGDSGRSKGIAYVEFETPEDAIDAYEEMHGKALDGRDLTVDFALDRGSDGGRGAGRNRMEY